MYNLIKVYSKASCPQCEMTKQLLKQREIPFKEYRIDLDDDVLDYVKSKGVQSAPYVETPIHSWTGFRPDAIAKIQKSEWDK